MNPEAWPVYLMLAVMWATALAYFVFLLLRFRRRKPPQYAHCGLCNSRLSEWFANTERHGPRDDPIGMRCLRCGHYSPYLTHAAFREAWISRCSPKPKTRNPKPGHPIG